ncbi:Gfo/Idh/MocA family oxidoreductase [Treponema sp. OttesenSCG-928-L16]|nr:Gfo/Idh/MocA family oxidoreductase [Treponema sp. OttesenSCG-928-L16]
MRTIRLVLAGIGGYGEAYLKELFHQELPGVVLSGVVDPYAAGSPYFEEIKKRNIPVFDTMKDFYASCGADLAVIASPVHTHYEYAAACLEHRTNVLCEKPVCADLAELDDLIKRESASACFIAVGYQLCYSRDILALKADILRGDFGRPHLFKSIRMMRRETKYYRRNGWAGRKSFQGRLVLDSPLSNACAHQLQNMLFLLGSDMASSADVLVKDADLWQVRPDIENYDAAAIRASDDAGTELLFYTAHCIEAEKVGPIDEFHFEDAVVSNGADGEGDYVARFRNGTERSYGAIDKGRDLQKLYDCIDAVRTGTRPACCAAAAGAHVRCVNMVQEFPIMKVPEEKKQAKPSASGNAVYLIPGFEKELVRCYSENILPSESGLVLW